MDTALVANLDSEKMTAMERALAGHEVVRPIPVLLELGVEGGRTGARTVEAALAVAAAVERTPVLELAGVECFEGILHEEEPVDALLRDLRRLLGDRRVGGAGR